MNTPTRSLQFLELIDTSQDLEHSDIWRKTLAEDIFNALDYQQCREDRFKHQCLVMVEGTKVANEIAEELNKHKKYPNQTVAIVGGHHAAKEELELFMNGERRVAIMVRTLALALTLSLNNGNIVLEVEKSWTDSYGYNPLEKLWHRFHEGIKISVDLKYASDKRETLADFASFQGMGIDPRKFACVGSVTAYPTFFFHREPKVQVKIVAEVNKGGSVLPVSNQVQVQDLSHPILSMNRMIFEEGLNSDVIIVTKNAVEIKGHQCFLSARSPVLREMFQEWTQESKTRRVDMSDVAENVVRAFLRFIYFGDLVQVKGDAEVAFELLKMAEKYDVQQLKNEMSKNLMEIRNGLIKIELAFQMYMFTRNIDSGVELQTKTRGILRANFSEMKALHDYKDLFIESPSVAMEIFEDFVNSS